jgi:hypothetical protein
MLTFVLIMYNSPVCELHRTNSLLSASTNTVMLCERKARYCKRYNKQYTSKILLIVPTDAHYYIIIEMLKNLQL